jgi:hypothetical protein
MTTPRASAAVSVAMSWSPENVKPSGSLKPT